MKLRMFLMGLLLLPLLFTSSGCDPENIDPDLDFTFGWTGEDDVSTVPTSTNFGFGNTGNLPSSVDLVPKFPPIGDQGAYGTCVAWAVAYNMKTAVAGIAKGLSGSQLSSASNQFSPKDLFIAIPDNEKGTDCNGTDFTSALTVLQDRGVATQASVPYTQMGDCGQANSDPAWTAEANQFKIQYWRKIEPTITSIKQNLANSIPVVMGAKLADNFMSWNSDEVLTSNTSFNNVGQHAYHAMVIGGYDDNKGPNGAFKVINSWGPNWGDSGYIWVDYNFFINTFCTSYNGDKPLFIAANQDGEITPPDGDPTNTGVDLAPWAFSDYSNYWTSGIWEERVIDFNVYNIGNQAASPSSDWSIYYIYFNAYDANEYGVLFYDEFNTTVPANTYDCPTNYNCIFNISIPAGGDFAGTAFGWGSVARTYYMPDITGEYYLVLLADGYDSFSEQDEMNNIFYTTEYPKYFQNGYGLKPIGTPDPNVTSIVDFKFENPDRVTPELLAKSKYHTGVKPDFRNAYTPAEVMEFIKREKANGNLDKKIDEHIQQKDIKPFSHN